ncbi:MAG: cupin domain-containing protein [Synergistaceae bacterium]|jgi:dTDP-4-dehydrorhamnose 3,5-epimerase-like enzyme|nr:cupin domain-containing protein [Synergistaceae bacterium]
MKSELVYRIDRYARREDPRGCFEGLIHCGSWQEINLITSYAGVTRGGHYHKKADELFFIIEGEIAVQAREVIDGTPAASPEDFRFAQGDVFIVRRNVYHTFHILKPSRWINALSVAFDENQPDIFTPGADLE